MPYQFGEESALMQGMARKSSGIPHFRDVRKMVEGCRIISVGIATAILAGHGEH